MIYSVFQVFWVGEIEAPDEETALELFRMVTGDLFQDQDLSVQPKTDRRKAERKSSTSLLR
jgi:hypothetical protein